MDDLQNWAEQELQRRGVKDLATVMDVAEQLVEFKKEFFQAKEAAKILANLLIMGSGIMARALVQAYRQALTNASKSGVAQETLQNTIRRASKTMAEPEARQILGVTEQSSWEEILQKYDTLFERNAKNGSFYLQSKVHRAKECLETLYQEKAQGTTGS
ncbi:hypothetical protein HHK36_005101 [Tetracentron sinense]|uniref:Mitochondrial import inner membrane translocase subunit Tim16 n=1 Tax=Tetracentron sinense TaxID=13715 RepID=A0A834ZKK7_TETSI|nr:hypothetical protein HHK36_005101 [Tetracentron sinense]